MDFDCISTIYAIYSSFNQSHRLKETKTILIESYVLIKCSTEFYRVSLRFLWNEDLP